MKRFIEGEDRSQSTLFPEHLEGTDAAAGGEHRALHDGA
jgi:hypothetical protein